MTNRWTIALFAGLAETFGTRNLQQMWAETELAAGDLKRRLMALYPAHADIIAICFLASNQAYAHEDAVVSCRDELALLPPVSGGSGEDRSPALTETADRRFAVVQSPINVNEAAGLVSHPDHGAALVFIGTTREWTGGKRTVSLAYEAYVPMAIRSMRSIGDEIAERWPGTITAITHRIGTVGVGEISVVIAVSSPHRAEGYEASRYAIERLKMTVPLWKKEVYEDGTEWKGHQLGPWDPLAPQR